MAYLYMFNLRWSNDPKTCEQDWGHNEEREACKHLVTKLCRSHSSLHIANNLNNFVHVFKVCLPYFSSILVTVNSFAKVFNS